MNDGASLSDTIRPNTTEALDFLRGWQPEGPWHLVAIVPDGRPTARSFDASEEIGARVWIDNHQGKANLYFHVNELNPGCRNRKAKKPDVARAIGLHVDVDDLTALPLLQQFEPRPTVIINSGGGFQAFWKCPVPSADFAEVEARNADLATRLGGDNCHNIDRLMRLPGTINIPNEKKRGRGRTNSLAYIVEANWELCHPISAFPRTRSGPQQFPATGNAVFSGPENGVKSITDLSALEEWGVAERLKVIIQQGHHPEEGPKARDNSRSAWLFDVLCGLLKHGVPGPVVHGIITDQNWPISESVLEKGASAVRYAARQIERAKREVNRERAAFLLTDVGNGERIGALHGDDMRYCYPWKQWIIWDETRFRLDENGAAHRKAKEAAASIYDEAARLASGDAQNAKRVASWAHASQSRRSIESALVMAQSELPVHPDELDSDDSLLNLQSGTLDLRTLTHREHRREDLITKLAPVVFDAAACCPQWLTFLNRIYDDNRELIEFVQRAVGYSLTGQTDEQVFFLLHGYGANGKSTLIETLLALFGDYARPTEFRTLLARENSDAVRNDVAALVGLRLVTAVEVGHGKRLDEAVVKQLTGGDKITARFLHKEFFDFRPKFKLFLAANHKPEIRGVDEAIWRRVMLIPHAITIPRAERDRALGKKLLAELPGILNWALEGLRAWRLQGLNPPASVLMATAVYRAENDIIGAFLDAECFVDQNSRETKITTSALFQAYEHWCSQNGEEPVKKRTFGTILMERGFSSGLERAQRIRFGVRLLTEAERKQRHGPDVQLRDPV